MDMGKPIFVNANLASRIEPLFETAGRFEGLLSILEDIDPLLRDFYSITNPEQRVPVPRDLSALEKMIHTFGCLDGTSVPTAETGFYFSAWTMPESNVAQARRMAIHMKAGGSEANRVWLQSDWDVVPDPRLRGYSTVKNMLFAIADAFEPLFSNAYSGTQDRDAMMPAANRLPLFTGWMVLLPADLARQVTPPTSALKQTRPDGSLFMAATDDTFDVTNPGHMAVSKAMQDAIAPINDWSLCKPSVA